MCWFVAVSATVATGERASTWAEVRTLVATGEVDAVRIVGEVPDRGTGYSVVEVHWRRGPLRYRTEVVQVLGNGGPAPDAAHESATGVLHEPPSSRLTRLQPGLQVTQDPDRSNSERLLGWMVPSWIGFLAALLFFPGLAVLIAGPTPWRAPWSEKTGAKSRRKERRSSLSDRIAADPVNSSLLLGGRIAEMTRRG